MPFILSNEDLKKVENVAKKYAVDTTQVKLRHEFGTFRIWVTDKEEDERSFFYYFR